MIVDGPLSGLLPNPGWSVAAPAALLSGALALLLLLGLGAMAIRRRRRTSAATAATDRREAETSAPARTPGGSELRTALWSFRNAFVAVAGFSAIINVLMLTGAIFMLEVYDRVLPSRSVETLIGLVAIAAILFAALAALDVIRSRLLARIASALDDALAPRLFDLLVVLPARLGHRGHGLQPLRDLDAVRGFLSGAGPTALFDLPWLPFYLVVVYSFHPLLGATALLGAIVLVALTVATELLMRRSMRDAAAHTASRFGLAEAAVLNAEALLAMGFAGDYGRLWRRSNSDATASQLGGADIGLGLGAVARVLRMVLQSAMLAVGAYLAIIEQASAGIIIAGSILAARALAPVDTAIASWRGFVAARQGWQRLGQMFAALPASPPPMPLPAPVATLQAENLVVAPPGERKAVLRDVSFVVKSGQGLGIVGPSAAGKSSLARVLVGAWLPLEGRVLLDGAALDQRSPQDHGRHIGYLPQEVKLFAGSILENISRFDPQPDPDAVLAAARAAGVHDVIVRLPGDKGYQTPVGDGGMALSAGQRQRIALARALYRDPFLVVLDEPDASLDEEGLRALRQAILTVRARGGVAVVISHRPEVLDAVDLLLAVDNGRPLVFGPKQLAQQWLAQRAASAVHVLKRLPDPQEGAS